jgi:drug/metabolite transporter (DMT)-like permease
MNVLLPVGSVALTVVLWACAFPAIRAGLGAFRPGELAAGRFLLASAVLALYVGLTRPALPARRDLPRIGLAGALGIAAYNLLLNSGEMTVDAGTASFLVNTAPIFTAGFGLLFLHERLRGWGWAGFALSFAGAALIAMPHVGEGAGLRLGSGAVLVLGAALCQAAQFVLQKPLLARYGVLHVTAWVIWVGTFLLLPFAPAFVIAAGHASAPSLAAVVFLGLGPAAVAYVAWSYALSRMPVSRAASFLYIVPAIATAVAFFWLGERPSPTALLGGAIALAGVVLVNTLGRRPLPASIHNEESAT